MTTIKLKNGSGAPAGGDLVQGEPALDLTNKRLYTENGSGDVIEVGTNPTSITTGDITATGTASFANLATTGDITFGDDDKAIFGAGSDLQIYHDGSNSYVKDAGTGQLILQGSTKVILKGVNGDNFLQGNEDGAVNLYYNDSQKLATTSTGIDVTGTVTADGLTVDGASQTTSLKINTSSSAWADANADDLIIRGADIGLTVSSSTTGNIYFGDATTAQKQGQITYTHSSDSLSFATAGTERMRINSSGNLLVGATSFATNLSSYAQIEASGSNGGIVINSSSTGASDYSRLIFTKSNSDGNEGLIRYNTNDYHMAFWTDSTERMRIDASGNVGIGTDSPIAASGYANLTLNGNTGGQLHFTDNNVLKATIASAVDDLYVQSGAQTIFRNGGFTSGDEAMRIDSSGNLLVGTTSTTADEGGLVLIPQTSSVSHMYIGHATGTASGNPYMYFRYGSGNIGSITQSGTTAVLYNTSSDQRLKDNIVDAPSASDDIDAIQVRSFDWKADGSHQKYGMIAQELQSVAPEAVSGDATEEEMMGVDYSKLVPMMLKEIQSLRARVAQLEGEA